MDSQTAAAGRPLIISYSYAGHTHRVAQAIQSITGADWCEIHPRQPYPASFPELLAQVRREVRTGCRPELLPSGRTPRLYTVVFAGSPNWCGTIAPPLASWLSRNQLAGKIILPFYSHCGGVPCDFQRDIRRLCPGADVREALGVLDDSASDLPALLRQWISRTGLTIPAAWRPDDRMLQGISL